MVFMHIRAITLNHLFITTDSNRVLQLWFLLATQAQVQAQAQVKSFMSSENENDESTRKGNKYFNPCVYMYACIEDIFTAK